MVTGHDYRISFLMFPQVKLSGFIVQLKRNKNQKNTKKSTSSDGKTGN
jgi:hypothetical protein